jgi:hypothetical protein
MELEGAEHADESVASVVELQSHLFPPIQRLFPIPFLLSPLEVPVPEVQRRELVLGGLEEVIAAAVTLLHPTRTLVVVGLVVVLPFSVDVPPLAWQVVGPAEATVCAVGFPSPPSPKLDVVVEAP